MAMTYRDLESPYCSQCVKPMVDETPVECEGCFLERYCSKSCAEAAEGSHHARTGECATFATAVDAEAATLIEGSDHSEFEFDDAPQRFIIRVLCQAGGWRERGGGITGEATLRRLLKLQSHEPEVDSDEREWLSGIARNTLRLMEQDVDEGVKVFGEKDAPGYGVEELVRLMCCVRCNSHTLYASEEWPSEPVGTAVYLKGSAFNHSCLPSAEFYNEGTSLRVRSVRDISAGEEVTISYVPVTETLWDRRQALWRQYKFDCECDRCILEEEDEEKMNLGGGAGSSAVDVSRRDVI